MTSSNFKILATSEKARTGEFRTGHGVFETPAFMPVGTQGSVKGVTPLQLEELGAQIILANTYHLHLRPGDELIREMGGIHKFIGWDKPILTDSGGFQIFSLSKLREVSEEGVLFQSHLDGVKIFFTPESIVQIQENLGVDIMMVLDVCLSHDAKEQKVEEALAITSSWAKRCKQARAENSKAQLFGIVQGGMFRHLRVRSAQELTDIDFDSYAIGGLSVGECTSVMREMTEICCSILPENKLRYLMGVGTPLDLIESIALGVDLFDCVIPTRSARFGRLYTKNSWINIRNKVYRNDSKPIDEKCDCYTCSNFSRAYISHLIHAKEMLGSQLASLHNLRFYQRLMQEIRAHIKEGTFACFVKESVAAWKDFEAASTE